MRTNQEIIEATENIINQCKKSLKLTLDFSNSLEYEKLINGSADVLDDMQGDIKFVLEQDDEQNAYSSNREDYERLTGHEFGLLAGRV